MIEGFVFISMILIYAFWPQIKGLFKHEHVFRETYRYGVHNVEAECKCGMRRTFRIFFRPMTWEEDKRPSSLPRRYTETTGIFDPKLIVKQNIYTYDREKDEYYLETNS